MKDDEKWSGPERRDVDVQVGNGDYSVVSVLQL